MKRILPFLLGLLFLTAWAAPAQLACTTNNGSITITGYTGSDSAVIIPATTNGLPVTSIGDNAFFFCYALTNVAIPSSVTNIGTAAFVFCFSLTALNVDPQNAFYSSLDGVLFDQSQTTLIQYPGGLEGNYSVPDGVTTIGGTAFEQSFFLTNLTIPNSITNIGEESFNFCSSLASVKIPDSVITIGEGAFAACQGLTNVIIGHSITSIADESFYDCSSLASLTIPTNVILIRDAAFAGCSRLTSVYFLGDAPLMSLPGMFDGDTEGIAYYMLRTTGWGTNYGGLPTMLWNPLIQSSYTTNSGVIGIAITGYSGTDSTLIIPAIINNFPVTSIGDHAFQGSSLTNFTLPNGITSIGIDAFADCSNLISLVFPASRVTIGNEAFAGCPNLTDATLADSVANIGNSAFADCSSLTNITIPHGVTNLGDSAFADCSELDSVPIPGSVVSVGADCFINNTSLTTVTIANGVTGIESAAFMGCIGLTEITIPGSVTNIATNAFANCPSLTDVYFTANPPVADSSAFAGDGQMTIHYLYGNTGWGSTFAGFPPVLWLPYHYTTNAGNITITGYTGPSGTALHLPPSINDLPVTSMQGDVFGGSRIVSIIIPGSVTNIGSGAFVLCTNLARIYFTGNAPTADSTVFSSDTNATVYYLPGTTGWSTNFLGRPALPWYPLIQEYDGTLGVRHSQFGFTINWASGQAVVVEACTNLTSPVWLPVQTVTLTNGSYYFSEPFQTNSGGRYYRIRSP